MTEADEVVLRDVTYSDHVQGELKRLLTSLERFGVWKEQAVALREVVERWDENDATEIVEEVSFQNPLVVAEVAGTLIVAGDRPHGDQLVNALRCCGEFPECSHVLAWVEGRAGDAA